MPYDDVLGMWRDCMDKAYQPEVLFNRYRHQLRTTWVNRIKKPMSPQRTSKVMVKKGLTILGKLLWHVGVKGDYRLTFWKFALPLLARGKVEALLNYCLPAHHLIMFAREACAGARQRLALFRKASRGRGPLVERRGIVGETTNDDGSNELDFHLERLTRADENHRERPKSIGHEDPESRSNILLIAYAAAVRIEDLTERRCISPVSL